MNIKDILSHIDTLPLDDLRKLNEATYKILKSNSRALTRLAKSKLCAGQKVRFGSQTGTITKVNRTRCIVDTGGIRGRYTVPMTMLEVIG